ncbi:hypothetical protein EI94DRAFT_1705852 [Lactarius quietus]|nr:hypothetical protein EI94DRAFT_1705852 [Lactarius quietus]
MATSLREMTTFMKMKREPKEALPSLTPKLPDDPQERAIAILEDDGFLSDDSLVEVVELFLANRDCARGYDLGGVGAENQNGKWVFWLFHFTRAVPRNLFPNSSAQCAPNSKVAPWHKTGAEFFHCEMHIGKWWWSVQESLELRRPGATVMPVIISLDKTQLTLFRSKCAYPIYMTIGNIPRAICNKPSLQAQMLVGYIPTT